MAGVGELDNGTFNLSIGTTLTFSNGTQSFGTSASIIGGGTAILSGTMNFTGSEAPPMQFAGGSVSFSEDNTLSSTVTLSSGTVSVSAGKSPTLSGTAAWNAGGSFTGSGSVVVSAAAYLPITWGHAPQSSASGTRRWAESTTAAARRCSNGNAQS
ncbi:MAG: hypothetical protein WKF77_00920 [Planctomycetaceae bacterium]